MRLKSGNFKDRLNFLKLGHVIEKLGKRVFLF
jgi:hypothetical protein